MASSTTLMTFLVTTPPSTRTLSLLGSWDNFSKPYSMRRDTRLGAGHWTGCYSFENIICDGNVERPFHVRQGGLLMGGTYWYYYQLDDYLDFHNSAEPSTSSCPMLPGQVVNVLDVPLHLSSGVQRHRNASVSSTSSDLRTMNPEDRYLNPRPAPKPSLSRLNTSALQHPAAKLGSSPSKTSPSFGRSSHNRNASLPSSAVSLRAFRPPRKASLDERGRSASPTHKGIGLKTALHQLGSLKVTSPAVKTSREHSGLPNSDRDRPSLDHAPKSERMAAISSTASSRGRARTSLGGQNTNPNNEQVKSLLKLRQSDDQLGFAEDAFAALSFQSHRRQRSRSREPSPLRNTSLSLKQPEADNNDMQYQPLETLKEVHSAQITPTSGQALLHLPKGDKGSTHTGKTRPCDKRLPNLPNTPSSALPPSEDCKPSPRGRVKSSRGLGNKLPEVIVSGGLPHSTTRSHFSRWTCTTTSSFQSSEWSSVLLDGKSPSYSQTTGMLSHLTSPFDMAAVPETSEVLKRPKSSPAFNGPRMPSIISSSTVSSYDDTSPSSPDSATYGAKKPCGSEPSALQKRYGMLLGGHQRSQLPAYAQAPGSTAKAPILHDTLSDRTRDGATEDSTTESFPYSNNMQHLLNELRYLSDLIQE